MNLCYLFYEMVALYVTILAAAVMFFLDFQVGVTGFLWI